jgi:hypothetical protein
LNPTLQGILNLLAILGATAGKVVGGQAGQDIQIGDDLLLIAQQALNLHAQNSGLPIDQVIAQLHDLPPLPGSQDTTSSAKAPQRKK